MAVYPGEETGEEEVMDRWLNKILLGDCLDVMREMPDKCVDLVLTDPPYNIGKDSWDKIDNYHAWLGDIFFECSRILKDNGTLWFFHMSFPDLAIIHQTITSRTDLRFKQFITINKGLGSIAGRCSMNTLRSYPRATEYLMFYTFEDLTGAEQLSDKIARRNPMAAYLRSEIERAGATNREIANLFPSKTGGMTGCVSNWLLGLNFPLKEQYQKIKEYLGGNYLRREYEDLRREYEDLRREYEDLRYTFNLPKGITDVWDINFYGDRVIGHCTPKPITLLERIIYTVTKKGGIVLDPFMGTGSTVAACINLERQYIGIELNPEYIHIANERIKQATRQARLFP